MPEYLFIYDHTILQGKEDSNYDPTEAILYFHPSSTTMDHQHSLCSHVMGFCQILSNLFQSSPKQFTLDSGAKIACINEPHFGLTEKSDSPVITFALYSDDTSTTHLFEKCTLLYESLIFYIKKCLRCTFRKKKLQSNYISGIITRLMGLISHRDKLSSIFDVSLNSDHNDKNSKLIDPLIYQTMVNLTESIQHESEAINVRILGSCLFYKKMLILNQFSVEISNLFSLLMDCLNNDSKKNSKDTFDPIKKIQIDTELLQTRNGVFVFQVCLTKTRYYQALEYSQNGPPSVRVNCCNSESFQYVHLYLEHHSNTTIMVLIDEPNFTNSSKQLLKIYSNLCFNVLGDIEAQISINTSTSTDKTDSKGSTSSSNTWNINYDDIDRSLRCTNSLNGTNITNDWEEWLLKRVNSFHENLEKEKLIKEIHVKSKKETLTAIRNGNQHIYTMKSSN